MSNKSFNADLQIRVVAFEWLKKQVDIHGDVLPRALLQSGFQYKNVQIPLVAPQGIFKPKQLSLPLSITTTPNSPYKDTYKNGLIQYSHRSQEKIASKGFSGKSFTCL